MMETQNFLLDNGQPDLKAVNQFLQRVNTDHLLRLKLWSDYCLQTHIVRQPDVYFKSLLVGMPNKHLKQLLYRLDL